MWSYQRIRRLCPWKPHVKRGKDPLPLKVPQYEGNPGWMLLTHNEKSEPQALFVDSHDRVTPVSMVMDERIFSDTVLRVIQVSKDVFLACDLRWLNGKFVYETMNYSERRAKLDELLDLFHFPDLAALITYDEVHHDVPIRGYEYYDESPGSMGVFLPASE